MKHLRITLTILVFASVFSCIFLLFKKDKNNIAIIRTNVKPEISSPTQTQISPLTLEKIFFGDKTYLQKLPQDDLITILSTGDIIPARMVNFQSTKFNDFTWSFKNVANSLQDADFTVANLESPLMASCKETSEGMTFCGSDKNIEGLVKSGIDLVTLANNHIDNYGQEGIDETIKLLSDNNIKYTGLNKITYVTIKKLRFAFIGWNFLLSVLEDDVIKQVTEAKNNSDFVIVFPHWGEEYQEMPSDFEKNMQKILLSNGVNIIVGNHPHIIQPISINDNSLTIFAHGNFIFDQEWSEGTKKGILVKAFLYQGKIIDAGIIPIYIKDYGQPEIVTGETKTKMINDLYKLSLKYVNNN